MCNEPRQSPYHHRLDQWRYSTIFFAVSDFLLKQPNTHIIRIYFESTPPSTTLFSALIYKFVALPLSKPST